MTDRCSTSVQAACEPIIFLHLLVKARNKHEWTSEAILFKLWKDVTPFFKFKSTGLFVGQNRGFNVMIGQIACQTSPCEIKSQNDLFSFCIQWWKWASIGIYPSVGFRKVRVSHCLVLMGWEIITSLNNSINRANVSRGRYRWAMGRLGGRIDNLWEVIISALWTVWRWRAVM